MPDASPTHGKGIEGFLKGETAGLPNWAWILIVAAGIAAAVIVPKFFGGASSTDTSSTPDSGIGLAIDPTTGLPYAVEGLVPLGAGAGAGATGGSITPTPGPTSGLIPLAGDTDSDDFFDPSTQNSAFRVIYKYHAYDQ